MNIELSYYKDAHTTGADRAIYLNWHNGTGGVKVGNGASAYGTIFAAAFTVSSDRRY